MPAFVTTHWSLIVRAKGESSDARKALTHLFGAYWPPVYAFIRRWHDPDPALDLTQGFFEHALERGLVGQANPSRGRFRSFLCKALSRYLADEHDREGAQKRGGRTVLLPLDADDAEARCGAYLTDGETPERAYERAWAETVLERAMSRLQSEVAAKGETERWGELRGLLTGASPSTQAAVGARLGLSEGAVKVALHRLRKRYRELLRQEVAETVASEEEVKEEMQYLLRALGT